MAGRVKYHVDTAPTLLIHSSFDRGSQGALPPQPQRAGSKAPTVRALHWGCTSRAGEVQRSLESISALVPFAIFFWP